MLLKSQKKNMSWTLACPELVFCIRGPGVTVNVCVSVSCASLCVCVVGIASSGVGYLRRTLPLLPNIERIQRQRRPGLD